MSFNYFPLTPKQVEKRKIAWDGLAEKKAFGRVAYCLMAYPDAEELKKEIIPEEQIPLAIQAENRPDWDIEIRKMIYWNMVDAFSRYPSDAYPSLLIPRPVHGQSQGLAEALGCTLVPQESEQGLYFPVPWIESAADVDKIKVKPIKDCLYGKAIEFAGYAYAACNGQLPVRNPVMTGPIDTANYVLGTMRLMEWVYEEPQALHKLLDIITEILISIIKALQKVTEGNLAPDHGNCLKSGFALCSEVRHLISAEIYNEFEAPYLRRIGQVCGKYVIHSCGTWERTLKTDMSDPNLMMVHFQCKEMDLGKVYEITGGRLSLSAASSINLDERYTWPDEKSFFTYVMSVLPEPIPLLLRINDISQFLEALKETGGGTSRMFDRQPGGKL